MLLLFTFLITAFGSIQDCNTTSILQLTDLALNPVSPVPGKDLAMTVQFTNPGPEITNGTVTTSLTYNFIPFQPTTEDLCTSTQCPLVTGFNDRSTTNPWPDVKGTVISKIEWNTLDGQNLLCIQINVKSGFLRQSSPEGLMKLKNVFQGNIIDGMCPADDLFLEGSVRRKKEPIVGKHLIVYHDYDL